LAGILKSDLSADFADLRRLKLHLHTLAARLFVMNVLSAKSADRDSLGLQMIESKTLAGQRNNARSVL
jgi:hypothetical protein